VLLYSILVDFYEKIEATTKRGEMTAFLVELFKSSPPEDIDKVIYLTQGRLCPEYVGLELGIAEKLAMRALSLAMGVSIREVEKLYREMGDLGKVAERIMSGKRPTSIIDFFGVPELARKPLSVERVYNTFLRMAKATGEGSQDIKISLLTSLLKDASPKEAKYIM